jgi:Galactose oxidase, central domain
VLEWATVSAPPTRGGDGAGMAPDPHGQEAILFGGQNGRSLSATTQLYNESTNMWSTIIPSPEPSARSHFAFAANESGRVAVLFGGVVNASSLRVDNATWLYLFASRTWTNVSSVVAPPSREDAAFAIDPQGGFGLLFGGWNQNYTPTSTLTYSDLWKFDLTTNRWSQLHPSGSTPPPLHGATFVWDPASGAFLLFGGCYPCSSAIWQWNPLSGLWSLLPPANGTVPAPRQDAAWSWNPVDSAAVLFGGTNGAASYNDTFEYLPGTNAWIRQTPALAPSQRFASASTWLDVPGNETLFLSGGNGSSSTEPDLWRLAPSANITLLVQNASSGLALASARVLLDTSIQGTTDSAGYLNLTQLNPVETTVNVSRLGYADAERAFWLPPASSTFEGFKLTPVAPARVSVQVVANFTSVPLANVSVNLTVEGQDIAGSPQSTGASGFANFTNVPSARPAPNATVVAVSGENYSASKTFQLPPGSQVKVVLALTPYPSLHFEVTGLLANLTVVPVRQANLTEDDIYLGSTQATGWFNATSVLPGGNVTFGVSAEGFRPADRFVQLPHSGNFSVFVQLLGIPFGRFEVRVLEQVTDRPVEGATVVATANPEFTSVASTVVAATNSSGFANLPVPEGSYWVNVSAYGYFPYNSSLSHGVLSNSTVVFAVLLALLPGANVNVFVQAANWGPPIAGARVVMGTLPPTFTNAFGWANYTNVHFGWTIINVSHPGYFNNTTTRFLAPYENIPELLVNLTPLPVVSVVRGAGPGPFGNDLPPITMLWPYLVVLALTIAGTMVYLLALRIARGTEAEAVESTSESPKRGRAYR